MMGYDATSANFPDRGVNSVTEFLTTQETSEVKGGARYIYVY
jgi:hypothetical protein